MLSFVLLLALSGPAEPGEVLDVVPADEASDAVTLEERLGDEALRAGRRAEAESRYRRVLELDPRRPGVHFKLGGIALMGARSDPRGRGYGEAAKEFEAEILLDPTHLGALAGRANALAWTNFRDEAIAAFEDWIEAAPESPEPYKYLAQFFAHRGRREESLAVAKRLPVGIPGAAAALADIAAEMARHAASAQALEVLDRIPEAQRGERRVVALRVWALGREFRLDEALVAAHRLASLPPPESPDPISIAAEQVAKALEALPTLASGGGSLPLVMDPEAVSERLRPPTGTKPPSTVERIRPDYPEDALAEGLPGRAVLLVLVDAAGRVREVFPQPLRVGARPRERVFQEAALEVIRDWRYHPATEDGRTIPAYVVQRVHFKAPAPVKRYWPHGIPPDPDDPPDLGGGGGVG